MSIKHAADTKGFPLGSFYADEAPAYYISWAR